VVKKMPTLGENTFHSCRRCYKRCEIIYHAIEGDIPGMLR
jgi:hypothetical protein